MRHLEPDPGKGRGQPLHDQGLDGGGGRVRDEEVERGAGGAEAGVGGAQEEEGEGGLLWWVGIDVRSQRGCTRQPHKTTPRLHTYLPLVRIRIRRLGPAHKPVVPPPVPIRHHLPRACACACVFSHV